RDLARSNQLPAPPAPVPSPAPLQSDPNHPAPDHDSTRHRNVHHHSTGPANRLPPANDYRWLYRGGLDSSGIASENSDVLSGGRASGGRVLQDPADWKWIAGVKAVVTLSPYQLQRSETIAQHECLERFEVVVQVGEAFGTSDGEHEMPDPGVGSDGRNRTVEI